MCRLPALPIHLVALALFRLGTASSAVLFPNCDGPAATYSVSSLPLAAPPISQFLRSARRAPSRLLGARRVPHSIPPANGPGTSCLAHSPLHVHYSTDAIGAGALTFPAPLPDFQLTPVNSAISIFMRLHGFTLMH